MSLSRRLEWVGKKVASKDAAYPFRRASYSVRKRLVDRWFPTPRQMQRARFDPLSSDFRISGLVDYFHGRSLPRWHFELSEIEEIVARIPKQAKDQTVAEAQEIVNHRFAVFGHAPLRLDPMDWDYIPDGFLAWTAKLNRHDCFEVLGFAYQYSSDEHFARAFVELSNSWIVQIGPRVGRLEWDTPFHLARRINSWIWSFFLFLGSTSWGWSDQWRFLSTLGLLAEYLYRTIEYHSPGNHILLEAKALALCAEVFPEFEGARRWRRKAWRIVRHEIEAQVCEDGVHAERSTMYHRIIAGELAELWLFCSKNNIPEALELERVVQQMAEFQRWIDLGDGWYPLLGDSLARDSYYRFSAPVIVAASSEKKLPLENGVADHTWWVQDRRPSIKQDFEENAARAFPEGGYYVSRSRTAGGTNVLVWDCGPLGYEANRKHAHADALAIVLSVEGVPLLVDPGLGGPSKEGFTGTSAWMTSLVERWSELRTTRAHNTVLVDGEDQAILAERSEIWSPPEPEVVLWSPSDAHDVMWGHHDGYCRLPEPVMHERVIVASRDGYWLILDHLRGSGFHTAELRYHITPLAELEQMGSFQFRIKKTRAELLLTLFGPRDGGSDVILGREERVGELHNGHPETFCVIRGNYTGRVPFMLGTFLAVSGDTWEMRLIEVNDSSCTLEAANQRVSDLITVMLGGDDSPSRIDITRRRSHEGLVCRWTFQPKPNNRNSVER